MNRTRLSSKGQVIIPKEVRDRKRWRPGTELDVVETEEGVLLKSRVYFPPSTLEDAVQAFNYSGPVVPVEQLSIDRITYEESMGGGDDDRA